MNSLHPDYAHFCDEYQYFEFLFEIAEARYDVLASLLSYLNKHSNTMFIGVISNWRKGTNYDSLELCINRHSTHLHVTSSFYKRASLYFLQSRCLTQVASKVSSKILFTFYIYFISTFYNFHSNFLFLAFRNFNPTFCF